MSRESYIRGFCKAAESYGVDPAALAKVAAPYSEDAPEALKGPHKGPSEAYANYLDRSNYLAQNPGVALRLRNAESMRRRAGNWLNPETGKEEPYDPRTGGTPAWYTKRMEEWEKQRRWDETNHFPRNIYGYIEGGMSAFDRANPFVKLLSGLFPQIQDAARRAPADYEYLRKHLRAGAKPASVAVR